jgi:mono/diheme cytochrome c family protein
VAGQRFDLTFTIRQHGRTPLNDLTPRVRATLGRSETRVVATRGSSPGQYVAALTIPEPGEWTVNIHSSFGNSELTLLPITALASGARATALSDVERGRRLFVAKGCLGCHVNSAAGLPGEAGVGPDLTGRRYPAEYLQRFLADPASILASRAGTAGMPNLNLDPPEIAALVAFLNAETKVSGR